MPARRPSSGPHEQSDNARHSPAPYARTLQVDFAGPVEVTIHDRDRNRPFLVLHGGGGVSSMASFADLLAERTHSRVLPPTHPASRELVVAADEQTAGPPA